VERKTECQLLGKKEEQSRGGWERKKGGGASGGYARGKRMATTPLQERGKSKEKGGGVPWDERGGRGLISFRMGGCSERKKKKKKRMTIRC